MRGMEEQRKKELEKFLNLLEGLNKENILILPLEDYRNFFNLYSESRGGYFVPKGSKPTFEIKGVKIISSKEIYSPLIVKIF
jgi:hypothetical protein